MRTNMLNAGQPAYYTVREAAWILDVPLSKVAQAIRLGVIRASWQRGRLVVPARALSGLLGPAGGAP
jgi:hypothetical protein